MEESLCLPEFHFARFKMERVTTRHYLGFLPSVNYLLSGRISLTLGDTQVTFISSPNAHQCCIPRRDPGQTVFGSYIEKIVRQDVLDLLVAGVSE